MYADYVGRFYDTFLLGMVAYIDTQWMYDDYVSHFYDPFLLGMVAYIQEKVKMPNPQGNSNLYTFAGRATM